MKETIQNQIKSGGSPEAIFVLGLRGLLVLAILAIVTGWVAIGCSETPTKADSPAVIQPLTSPGTAIHVGLVRYHKTEDASIMVEQVLPGNVLCSVRIDGSSQIQVTISSRHFTDIVLNNPDWNDLNPRSSD